MIVASTKRKIKVKISKKVRETSFLMFLNKVIAEARSPRKLNASKKIKSFLNSLSSSLVTFDIPKPMKKPLTEIKIHRSIRNILKKRILLHFYLSALKQLLC